MGQQLEDRAKALFDYLQEVVRLGLRVFRTVEEHQEDFILFQNELPDAPGVFLFTASGDDLFWLSIHRQNIPNPPKIPKILEGWVEVSNSPDKEPQIIERQLITEGKNQKVVSFHENKSRENAFRKYLEKWEQWAKKARIKKKVQALFDKLFKVNERLKYDEQLELIWGHGLLLWKGNKYMIKYPLVTQRMVIEYRASEGVIHIFPEDDAEPKLELDVLIDTGLPDLSDVRGRFVNALRATEEATSQGSTYPLDFCFPILREIAGRLAPDGEFIELSEVDNLIPNNKLRIVNCWVLFLRKRRQDAIMRDIESFRDKLRKGGKAVKPPGALLSFVREPEKKPRRDEGKEFDEWKVVLDKQILFPKPANYEQIQILDRIERYDGVVVWGPPGTGKSHTIANLICHFMAKGKRVLVTSQKDQALTVLHDMLPEKLRPLCMSVLSNVRDGRERLERAVATITEIVSSSQPDALRKEMEELESKLDKLRERLTTIERKIKELSSAQFRYVKFDDEELLLAEVIKRVKEEEGRHTWLKDSPKYKVKVECSGKREFVHIIAKPPLSEEEIEELKTLRRRLYSHLDELSYDLPKAEDLVTGAEFQKITEDFQRSIQINNAIQQCIPGLLFKSESEKALEASLKALERLKSYYQRISESWQRLLLARLKEGSIEADKIKQAIKNLSIEVEKLKKLYQARDLLQGIALPEDFSLEELEAYVVQAVDRLKSGKKPFGLFDMRKRRALNSVLINGKVPGTMKEWEDILNYIQLLTAIKELKPRWNNFARSINAPQLPEDEILEQDARELLSLIEKSKAPLHYETVCLPKTRRILSSLLIGVDEVLTEANFERIYGALKLKKEAKSLQRSEALRKRLMNNLQRIASKGKPHPIVWELIECLKNNDRTSIERWEKAYRQVKDLDSLRSEYERFNKLLNKLAKQAPSWASKWKEPGVPEDELCPPYWQRSWWFKALRKYVQDVSNKIKTISQLEDEQNRLISDVRKTKEELVFVKVKLSLIENLTEAQLMALKRWRLAVRKLGKGRGKYTWQREKLVQKEMRQAKDAVPAWIMPLYRVSETTPSEFGIFDVVIIDEASQCDIRALLAIARGKKVIIVGDPEQISPQAVGIPLNEAQRLIKAHLNDIPNWDYFSPETSLYDLAEIVFSGQGVLMLKEHFRCVPEIIEFCNRLCYRDEILPLRNPPPEERLEPVLESVFVEGGYREGRLNINKPEARAICERIRQIVNDPRYEDKTIGVISLLGNEQARYIFNIIDEYITPEQQEKHKFRVGDPYTFQGDERDIILLSMVVGASDEKRSTTLAYDDKRYRQRFNVAVSRAKDKLILFHSVRLDELKPEDLRYQLLYYIQSKIPPGMERKKFEEYKRGGKFESPFEEAVYRWLTSRGYRVTPQVKIGHYRIDLVVEGTNSRLGIECDGDRWHPPEKWWADQIRQRQLERMGWTICRIWGSDFYSDPDAAMKPILLKLREKGITPSSPLPSV